MRVFVAGAAGVIGRHLLPLLVADGHAVTGTTRSTSRVATIEALGARASVVDAFDVDALAAVVAADRPAVVVHLLTDLAAGFDRASLRANARIRELGTEHLVRAAVAAGATRLVAQSGAWLYADAPGERSEDDPLRSPAEHPDDVTLPGIIALERIVRDAPIDALVLRLGLLWGPGTGSDDPRSRPAVHVLGAARAVAAAVRRGMPGTYNVVDDGEGVSNDRARTELGWDPAVR